ncbi:MAG: hypothetical protein V9H69_13340 [Anaerolineae bacterium]
MRGRGVNALSAQPDPEYCILLPQRAMHGDPDLPLTAPHTYRFLSQFRAELEARSSYRRFQRGPALLVAVEHRQLHLQPVQGGLARDVWPTLRRGLRGRP